LVLHFSKVDLAPPFLKVEKQFKHLIVISKMKHIFMIMSYIIFSLFSAIATNQIRPKLCIDCKFYRKEFFDFNEFGKCSLFPTENSNDYFLVNGNNNYNNKIEYHFCATARKYDHMCGKEGKFYESTFKKGGTK